MADAAVGMDASGPGEDAAIGMDAPSLGEDAPGAMDAAGLGTDLPLASTGELGTSTPDFRCRGARTTPAGASTVAATFRLAVFGQDGEVARLTRVRLYTDNVIAPDTAPCSGSCQEFTTGADGLYSPVMVNAGGWYAYRVFENTRGATAATRYTDSVQYNETAPTAMGGEIVGNAVAFSTIDLIPLSLGLERAPGTTLLIGRVQDCAGLDVGGTVIRAFGPDGSEIIEALTTDGPHYRYFRRVGTDSYPSDEQPYTNYEGLYLAMNILATDEQVRVEAWGRRPGDAAPVLLGCEGIRTLANGVSMIDIGPLRSDYPTGHPCHS